MAFYGCQFSFDGVSGYEYGLMVYDVGGIEEDGSFSSTPEIIEDRTSRRYKPLHYGVTANEPLTFTFTIGADLDSIDEYQYLDRWELDAIATWLTGQTTYKNLEIFQPDLEAVRYKVIITSLDYITYGKVPWAFKCTATCDSPYGYMQPEKYKYLNLNSTTATDGVLYNRACVPYYYPIIDITLNSQSDIIITNKSDNNRTLEITGVTFKDSFPIAIHIDNENEIITSSDGTNLYDNFNFQFFRLVRGQNELELKMDGDAVITCEFPINIGG